MPDCRDRQIGRLISKFTGASRRRGGFGPGRRRPSIRLESLIRSRLSEYIGAGLLDDEPVTLKPFHKPVARCRIRSSATTSCLMALGHHPSDQFYPRIMDFSSNGPVAESAVRQIMAVAMTAICRACSHRSTHIRPPLTREVLSRPRSLCPLGRGEDTWICTKGSSMP